MKYTFPTDYLERSCYLVAINASLIPLVAGALRFYEKRGSWATAGDHEQGYHAFAELQVCLMKACLDDLFERHDRLYRMLDTAIFGTPYSVVAIEPLDVIPAIEPTHDLAIAEPESILGRMDDLRLLLDNALNGQINTAYSRPDGIRDLLERLITTIEADESLDPEILAKLGEIAVLLA